jgi:hypothetical protein
MEAERLLETNLPITIGSSENLDVPVETGEE